MKRPLKLACLLLFLSGSLSAQFGLSPSQVPALQNPARENWRHWRTYFVVALGSPHHMIHDQVVNVGQPAELVGKFDYSSVAHKDLEDENVEAYLYDPGTSLWESLGRYRTNSDGKVFVQVQPRPAGSYLIKMVAVGDLSSAYGYLNVVAPGRKAVVFDIDGTLTTDDLQVFEDYLRLDEADIYGHAAAVVQQYALYGYQVLYVTGRPYWTADRTRDWLHTHNLPEGILRTTSSNSQSLPGSNTRQYKIAQLEHWVNDLGIEIVAAYGNATSDIEAFEAVGIPKAQTWIIGSNAGQSGTQAIQGDYSSHSFDLQFMPNINPAHTLPESAHPYGPNLLQWKQYWVPGAGNLALEFDPLSELEAGWDLVYIFDEQGRLHGGRGYTGLDLAGATLWVPGERVWLALVSDASVERWGYRVLRIIGY